MKRTAWFWKAWRAAPDRETFAKKWRDNMKKCSCWACGNQRRYSGSLPIQWRKLEEGAKHEQEEFGWFVDWAYLWGLDYL
jgi:hypothetical protein